MSRPGPGPATRRDEARKSGALTGFASAGAVFSLVLAAGLLTSGPASAESGVKIVHPWIRYIISARPAAGYFTLKNDTASMKVLTGASSPACGMIMLHRSMSKDGANAMMEVSSVSVAPRSSIEFSPGGYHLMCMSPSKEMKSHPSVPVELKFKDGSSVRADFSVKSAGGQ